MTSTLLIRKGNDFTRLPKPYPSYREAVLAGQDLAGYGNFMVDSPKVPTREEQLLLDPVRKHKAMSLEELLDI